MGSTMDKVKGLANEAAGNVKQAPGKAREKSEQARALRRRAS